MSMFKGKRDRQSGGTQVRYTEGILMCGTIKRTTAIFVLMNKTTNKVQQAN